MFSKPVALRWHLGKGLSSQCILVSGGQHWTLFLKMIWDPFYSDWWGCGFLAHLRSYLNPAWLKDTLSTSPKMVQPWSCSWIQLLLNSHKITYPPHQTAWWFFCCPHSSAGLPVRGREVPMDFRIFRSLWKEEHRQCVWLLGRKILMIY